MGHKKKKRAKPVEPSWSSFVYEHRQVLPVVILSVVLLLCAATLISALSAEEPPDILRATPPPPEVTPEPPPEVTPPPEPPATPSPEPEPSDEPADVEPSEEPPPDEPEEHTHEPPEEPPDKAEDTAPPSVPPSVPPPEPITSEPPETSVKLPILKLHHVVPDGEETNSDTITKTKLAELVARLASSGYTTVTTSQLREYVAGRGELPEKSVLITFDDGYESNYTLAYPLLKAYDMHAVISVIGWSMGRFTYLDGINPIIPHMTWEQLGEMVRSGVFEAGNHTYNMHGAYLPEGGGRYGVSQLDGESDEDYKASLTEDLAQLQDEFMANLGVEPHIFCFPYGRNSANTREVLYSLGFNVILTTSEGINTLRVGDSLAYLKRIGVTMDTDIQAMIDGW